VIRRRCTRHGRTEAHTALLGLRHCSRSNGMEVLQRGYMGRIPCTFCTS
jgi:hypothetical protein